MIRTSATHPLEIVFVDPAVLSATGALGLSIAPGKHCRSVWGPFEWRRDLDQDLARIRQVYGIEDVVSLLERDEQHRLGIRDYRRVAHRQGITLVKLPVPDLGVPGIGELRQLAERISAQVSAGRRVLVHCRGGLGRSGLVVAAVLVARGLSPEHAIAAVRAVRPGAIETAAQMNMVHRLAAPAAPAFGDWMGRLRLGAAQRVGALDVYPVTLPGGADAPWLSADQAIRRHLLSVAETGEGAVQQVIARSKAAKPILVLEGETLVGCKQNRVVTRSALVAPGVEQVLEVGCMEQGRWRRNSSRFGVGGMRMEAGLRQRTVAERAKGGFDQGRLWAQVEDRLTRSSLRSGTSDYHAFVSDEAPRAPVGLRAVPEQVGVLVLHGEALVALELLGSTALWTRVASRTLPSLLLAGEGRRAADAAANPGAWLARVGATHVGLSPALGLGTDLVVEGSGFVGAGLWAGQSMAHLAVFAAG